MTKLKFLGSALALLLLVASCQENQVQPESTIEKDVLDKESLALDVVDLLNNQANRDVVIKELQNKPVGVAFKDLVNRLDASSTGRLANAVNKSNELISSEADKIEVPELWLHNPGVNINNDNLLVAFPPSGNEEDWTKVKAFTLNKEVVYLDPNEEPNRPVVVVETSGFEALKVEVKFMNEMFKKAGLQHGLANDLKARKAQAKEANGLETTKLNKIRLNDDQEPWISGSAEIYAVTTGIRNSQNEAELTVTPMYYLDKDGKDYYPNQVMLFWDDYAYQAANIQLFEKDDNHNYKQLASVLIEGVIDIVGTLYGQPWVTALGKLAGAVIQAMPDEWWTNNDDYVDSFYTIEKNRTYTNYYGAAGNARVNMAPYFIPAN